MENPTDLQLGVRSQTRAAWGSIMKIHQLLTTFADDAFSVPDCEVISGTVRTSLLARDTNQCAISFLLPYVREDMKIRSVVIVSFFLCARFLHLSQAHTSSIMEHHQISPSVPFLMSWKYYFAKVLCFSYYHRMTS